MRITAENQELFTTGSFLSYKDLPVTMEFSPELKLTIFFKADTTNQEPQVNWKVLDKNHATLDLVNFDSTNGSGFLDPVKLGSINKRRFTLILWVSKPAPNVLTRRVEYTGYLAGGTDGL